MHVRKLLQQYEPCRSLDKEKLGEPVLLYVFPSVPLAQPNKIGLKTFSEITNYQLTVFHFLV